MNDVENIDSFGPALSGVGSVKSLAEKLQSITSEIHATLRRFAISPDTAKDSGYELLTEEYGLRVRSNILFHNAKKHVVSGVEFSHEDMMVLLEKVRIAVANATTIESLTALVVCVITFASSIWPGRSKVVNFLILDLAEKLDEKHAFGQIQAELG